MVFCGTAVGLCNQFGKLPGQLCGYLVVRQTATIKGDSPDSPLGSSDTNLVVGETPDSPIVIPPSAQPQRQEVGFAELTCEAG